MGAERAALAGALQSSADPLALQGIAVETEGKWNLTGHVR
jgi:hypothetical protein